MKPGSAAHLSHATGWLRGGSNILCVCLGGGVLQQLGDGHWSGLTKHVIRAKYGKKTWSRRLGTQRSPNGRTVSTQQRQQERQFGMFTSMNVQKCECPPVDQPENWLKSNILGKTQKCLHICTWSHQSWQELDRICREENHNVSKSKCAKTEASNEWRLEVLIKVLHSNKYLLFHSAASSGDWNEDGKLNFFLEYWYKIQTVSEGSVFCVYGEFVPTAVCKIFAGI